jgi:hypothetical protein
MKHFEKEHSMREIALQGAILVVNMHGKHGGVLKAPEVVTIGGRPFLTGIASYSQGNWANGQAMHLALDQVESIVEFQSEAEHLAKCKSVHRRPGGIWARLLRG